MRLSHKLALVFSLFGAALAAGFQYRQTLILRDEIYANVQRMSLLTLRTVSALVEGQWREGRVPELGRQFEALVREVGVASLVVKDGAGRRLLGRSDTPEARRRAPHAGLSLREVPDDYYDLEQSVRLGGSGAGKVEMSFHTDKLEARLGEIAALGIRDGVMAFLAIGLAAWFIGSWFGFELERILPRLEELARAPERFRALRVSTSVDEVSRLIVAFNRLGASLKEETFKRRKLEQEKTELAAMLVHDLKTPLTVISSGVGLLEDRFLESLTTGGNGRGKAREDEVDWHRTFELLDHSVRRLRRMVEDVLELSRMEEVEGLRSRAEVDLAAMARAAARDYELIAKDRGRKIALEFKEGFPTVVLGEEALLRRLLDNLVYNAIEHAPAGSAVAIRVDGSMGVRVSVSDAGPGIPPHAREEIFRKFFQNDLKRHLGNVGLGLALCAKVVERHGGTIGVEDAEPKGARFYFTIPPASA